MNEVKYGLAGVIADDTAVSEVMPEISALTYRGYPVHDLATQCRFEETAYLILYGELPDRLALSAFCEREIAARGLPDMLIDFMRSFSHQAHPMDTLRTCVSWLGQHDMESEDSSPEALMSKAIRLLAQIPQIVAIDSRLREGKEPITPDRRLNFSENVFHMCFGEVPRAKIVRCFDISMTLYAEHSFNASTFTARSIVSSLSDLYSGVIGAIGSLKGALHGGANEAVMHMLDEIGSPDRTRQWMLDALADKRKIMGFGHRVYRKGDSRVPTMTEAYRHMVELTGSEHAKTLWKISDILEQTMLEYKGIYPNLDFPAGPAYHLMGFPTPVFTPLFVMSRITGWCAHIMEQAANNRLVRPLSNYTGSAHRAVLPLEQR